MADTTIWGIHAGHGGDADDLFLKKNNIAIGWAPMGDLSKVGSDRDAFKSAIAKVYPDKKPGAIPNNAGQLFRFVHEVKANDVIVYPSKRDRRVHIGRVTGPYKYDPAIDSTYPNLRPVQWVRSLPRTKFTQGALYEIG